MKLLLIWFFLGLVSVFIWCRVFKRLTAGDLFFTLLCGPVVGFFLLMLDPGEIIIWEKKK